MEHHKSDSPKIKTQKHKNQRRIPKKITPTYLHNSGLYYLERFSASKAHFKTVMMRKVKRSCMHHADQDYEECRAMVDALADKFEALELLNDAVYARGVVGSLRRRGFSRTAVMMKMRAKGIEPEDSMRALQNIDEETGAQEPEFNAALKLARKKKMGPYYLGDDEPNVQKWLGAFARAGFSYDIARRVLDIDDSDLMSVEGSGF